MCICSTALTCSLAAITLNSTFFLFLKQCIKVNQHTIVIMIIMSYIIYFGMYTLVASFMTFAVWFPLALGGGGVLPYMGYIGMCRCEGYGFQAVYSRIGYINQNVWV